MNDPSAESQRQAEHRQAILLLNDLETRRKEVLVQYEQQTTELKRQIQHPHSEIDSLRTTSSPSLSTNNLAQELNVVASHASRLGLRTRDQPKPREVEVLGHVLCQPWRRAYLETLLQEGPQHPDGMIRARYYCLGQIGMGAGFPALTFRSDGHVDCPYDGNGDNCVWITKREVGWVIGSRA